MQKSYEQAKIEYEVARTNFEQMEKQLILSSANFPASPSKDGYYHMNVKDSSTKSGRRQITAKTMEELQEKYYLYEKKGKDGRCKKTVRDVFDIVQSEKLKYVKTDEALISVKNTASRNQVAYRRFIEGTAFEKMYLPDIRKKDIEALIFNNLKRYDLNKKGLASLKSILKPIFDMAYQEYWIKDNPYARMDFKKFSKMVVDDVPIEQRYHHAEDIQRMFGYVHEKQRNNPTAVAPYALELQLITAFRRGEIPPLKWSDIDGCLNVTKEMIEQKTSVNTDKPRYAIVSHTKTHKNRKYPLTRELMEFLDRLRTAHEENGWDSEFLFPMDNECGCITVKSIYSFYYRMCKNLGIATSKDFIKGTHAFRRTRITEVTNKSGGNIILASQLFGNSPQVAKRHYYTGLDLEEAKRVLEAD